MEKIKCEECNKTFEINDVDSYSGSFICSECEQMIMRMEVENEED